MAASDDIYTFVDHPTLPAPQPPGVSATSPSPRYWHRRIDRVDLAIWIVAAVFVGALSYWAFTAGMNLRDQLWRSTRTIRFDRDIAHGFRFGNDVLRHAETQAKLKSFSDALAPPASAESDFRRLTTKEIIQTIAHYYDVVLDEHPDGKYELDYPPLRLTAMVLWVQHVQRTYPTEIDFPKHRNSPEELLNVRNRFADPRIVHDTLDPQIEDFAQPMLNFNAICDGVAAIAMFALVWLWVMRGSRPYPPLATVTAKISRRKKKRPLLLRWMPLVPRGILVFVIATAGFWYALVKLTEIPGRPSPVVALLSAEPKGATARITGQIDAQRLQTFYHVEWGLDDRYGNSTRSELIAAPPRPRQGDALPATRQVTINLAKLPAGKVIHYRLVASNVSGITRSNDEEFIAGGKDSKLLARPVGGAIWPDWTVWLRLSIIFLAMVISARMLPPAHRGWACGLIAALLVWFDPVTLLDAHVWPQWDVWILPCIVLSILFASLDLWVIAGAIIGIGCLTKGQLLLGTPVLILWPLFAGRIRAVALFLAGGAIAAAIVLSPMLLQSKTAWLWIASILVACGIVGTVSFIRKHLWRERDNLPPPTTDELKSQPFAEAVGGIASPPPRWRLSRRGMLIVTSSAVAATILVLALIFSHWPVASGIPRYCPWLLLAAIAIPPWLLHRRDLTAWGLCILAASMWLASFAYGGSFAWYKLGYEYGSVAEDKMAMGQHSFSNLPSLLTSRFGWTGLHDDAAHFHFAIPLLKINQTYNLELRSVLVLIYFLCVIVCSIAAAVHSKRRDPRLLIAVIAPWIIFPMILGQMSERYLLWASALTACCIAVSTGLTLLHVLLAVAGAGMMFHQLSESDPTRWPALYDFFAHAYPDAAWAMLLIAAIFLWSAVAPGRKMMNAELKQI